MDYKEFLEKLQSNLYTMLAGEYEVKVSPVISNNNQKNDAIVIGNGISRLISSSYLKQYYESLSLGMTLTDIANQIINQSLTKNDKEVLSEITDIQSVSNKIVYRLINWSMNKNWLEEVPHRIIEGDLAKVYYVNLNTDNLSVSSIMITNKLLSHWGMDKEKLDALADGNTPILFPVIIKDMNQLVYDIISSQHSETETKYDNLGFDQFMNNYNETIDSEKKAKMYVLSNTRGINGAGAILYPNVLQNFALEHESDFYILPSSTHEVILILTNSNLSAQNLRDMVREVNLTQVAEDEVLSNEIYYYDLSRNTFRIVKPD